MGKDRVDEGKQRGRRANVVKARRKADRRPFFMALGALALAGVAALAYQASKKSDAPKPSIVQQRGTPANAKPYVLGKPDAPVQIMEFADFECPGCAQFATITEPDVRQRLVDAGKARYSYYDFPLSEIHRNTISASNAAACADEQGRFWEMHDKLFNGQPNWNGAATDNPKRVFRTYASELGIKVDQWEQCYDAQKYLARIMGNKARGDSLGVGGTPTFVIGKRVFKNGLTFDQMAAWVDSAAVDARAAAAPARPPAKTDSAPKRKPGGA
ncbi:MAG: DsbA family protein [Gemmatimonadaceae bacterium]